MISSGLLLYDARVSGRTVAVALPENLVGWHVSVKDNSGQPARMTGSVAADKC
jgi:hypothetical protein